jgi:hypothetical protein
LFQANTGLGLNRDKVNTAGSRATTPYVSPYAQRSRKTAGPSPVHTAPNKAAPMTETPPMTMEADLKQLIMKSLAKKKKIRTMQTDLCKRQVRISKCILTFHIMHSLYEVHEMTALWVVSVHIPSACFISGSTEIVFMKPGT